MDSDRNWISFGWQNLDNYKDGGKRGFQNPHGNYSCTETSLLVVFRNVMCPSVPFENEHHSQEMVIT